MSVKFVEVVASQFTVVGTMFQHMVDDSQQRVGHGHYSALLTSAASQAAVLSLKVGVFFPSGGPSRLRKSRTKPAIAFGGLATLAFAGALVVARADAGPRGQVLCRRKDVHVGPDLRYHVLGGPLVKPRQGRHLGYGWSERAAYLLNATTELLDTTLQVFKVVQEFSQHKAVVFRNLTLQGRTQFGDLGPQLPSGQICHLFSVGLAADQGPKHVPSGYPQNVRGYRSQLDVGVFQNLLDAVGRPVFLGHQLRTMPSEVTQLPLRTLRDKAALKQPSLQQLGQPLAVLDVGLATRNLFKMAGIDQESENNQGKLSAKTKFLQ